MMGETINAAGSHDLQSRLQAATAKRDEFQKAMLHNAMVAGQFEEKAARWKELANEANELMQAVIRSWPLQMDSIFHDWCRKYDALQQEEDAR